MTLSRSSFLALFLKLLNHCEAVLAAFTMTGKNECQNVKMCSMMLIYFKYEIVQYCLLCEKVQIVWRHFKSAQDEYVQFFFFSFLDTYCVRTFANNLVQLVDRAALTTKNRIIPSPAFYNKRQLYCVFSTIQTLEDVKRPHKVTC